MPGGRILRATIRSSAFLPGFVDSPHAALADEAQDFQLGNGLTSSSSVGATKPRSDRFPPRLSGPMSMPVPSPAFMRHARHNPSEHSARAALRSQNKSLSDHHDLPTP